MSNLLKEAIADAKAVRETAMQNAKILLEEAFAPKLQSMLAAKLQQEMVDDEEDVVQEFENVDSDGTTATGFMGRDGDVMNEGESGYKADDHTNDQQGASNERSAGPSDQDTDSTPNVDTASEGPNAGGKLTPSKTDHSDVSPGNQRKASDQDTDQTPNVNTSSQVHVNESDDEDGDDVECDDKDEDDDKELNEIIDELNSELAPEEDELGAELPGEDDMGDEIEGMDDMGGEEPLDAVPVEEPVDGEESAVGAVDGVTGDEEGLEGEDEESIDIDEILREMDLNEEDCDGYEGREVGTNPDDAEYKKMQETISGLQKENTEYKKAYKVVKEQLNELNILNAKLLYTNKVFKHYGLNDNQKMKVVEAFDRSKNVREVKLTYANLCESFKIVNGNRKKSSITEGVASKAVKSTKPSAKTQQKQKQILSEGSEYAARFQKLAGIKR